MERWEKASPSRWHLNWKEHPRSGHLCEQRWEWGSTFERAQWGLLQNMGSRVAGEEKVVDAAGAGWWWRLGQAKRPEPSGCCSLRCGEEG